MICQRRNIIKQLVLITKIHRPLGNLAYVRIWHDNTGQGKYASWQCSAVLVRDIQTNEKFEFVLNRWLATEKDDGQVKGS